MHLELQALETKQAITLYVCTHICWRFFWENTYYCTCYSCALATSSDFLICFQGGHTSMNDQVANFGNTVQQLRRFFRGDNDSLNSYLSKCLFFSGMGSNDYLNNYFMPDFYSTSSDFTVKAFASALLQDYSRQLSVCSHLILNHSTYCYCITTIISFLWTHCCDKVNWGSNVVQTQPFLTKYGDLLCTI